MGKCSTIFYHEWLELLEDFTEVEAGTLMIAILKYGQSGELPEFADRGMRQAFKMMRFQVDRDRQKYEDRCEQNRENGKKGGRPSKPNGFSKNPTVSEKANGFSENRTKPKKPDNDYDYDNDNDNDNDNDMTDSDYNTKVYTGERSESASDQKKSSTVFCEKYHVPSEDEVDGYFADRMKNTGKDHAIEARMFFDYYDRKEWKINDKPIQYWMSVADRWIEDVRGKPKPGKSKYINYDQRKTSYDDLEEILLNR